MTHEPATDWTDKEIDIARQLGWTWNDTIAWSPDGESRYDRTRPSWGPWGFLSVVDFTGYWQARAERAEAALLALVEPIKGHDKVHLQSMDMPTMTPGERNRLRILLNGKGAVLDCFLSDENRSFLADLEGRDLLAVSTLYAHAGQKRQDPERYFVLTMAGMQSLATVDGLEG